MTLENYISIFEREKIENHQVPYNATNLVFPLEFYNLTKEMCNSWREVRGIITANLQESDNKKFYILDFIKTLGYGSSTRVYLNEDKSVAVDEFIRQNLFKKIIEFHSHTIESGDSSRDCFSEQDKKILKKMINKNPNYMHVLFTPTNILTFGKEKLGFILTKNTNQAVIKKYNSLDLQFEEILARIEEEKYYSC